MAVTLDVPPGVLDQAEQDWDAAQDTLSGAGGRLAVLQLTQLSAAVVAAVTSFVDVWAGEIAVLALQASDHARAFGDLGVDLEIVDTAEAERLRSLLPWSYRSAVIREA